MLGLRKLSEFHGNYRIHIESSSLGWNLYPTNTLIPLKTNIYKFTFYFAGSGLKMKTKEVDVFGALFSSRSPYKF